MRLTSLWPSWIGEQARDVGSLAPANIADFPMAELAAEPWPAGA